MLNPRQEKFVSLYASGQTAASAYGEVYGRAGHSAEASGARLLRNAEVQAHLRELRAKASQEAVMTLADVLGRLLEMYETPISALDENHPFTRRMTVKKTGQPGQAMRTVRIIEKPCPLAILQEIARHLGQKPAAKLGRAKGQPRASEVTVAEFVASLKIKAKGSSSQTA
jgi:phage terminase small subunit